MQGFEGKYYAPQAVFSRESSDGLQMAAAVGPQQKVGGPAEPLSSTLREIAELTLELERVVGNIIYGIDHSGEGDKPSPARNTPDGYSLQTLAGAIRVTLSQVLAKANLANSLL